MNSNYIGRFAPSPTGPVHFGTLAAAVGSYLQAKSQQGKWLLRIEDVDETRKVEGTDTDIIHTLETFGFEWDGDVLYQTTQKQFYNHALKQLANQSLVFPCTCSRKLLNEQLSETETRIYPGTCRNRSFPEVEEHAIRIIATNKLIEFDDIIMGNQLQHIKNDCGDFVIKRRDGLFAYQLAVVVDDAMQGVTEIVRGSDLLDSTPRQIYLQQLLGYSTPAYAHLPLAVDEAGNKISKSTGPAKVDISQKQQLLHRALGFLGQNPPADLPHSGTEATWQWAIENWEISKVPVQSKITI